MTRYDDDENTWRHLVGILSAGTACRGWVGMNLDSMLLIGIMKEATCTYICVHIVQAPGQTLEQVPRGRMVENIARHFSPGRAWDHCQDGWRGNPHCFVN